MSAPDAPDADDDLSAESLAETDAGGTQDDTEEMRALVPAARRVVPRGRAPSSERLYIVAYDIADQKRWRRVFRTMKGYGRWLQLSVFQCRLSGRRRADLGAALERLIHHGEDHVVILDLGLADEIDPRVESIGKSFTPITREAVII